MFFRVVTGASRGIGRKRLSKALRRLKQQLQHCQTRQPALLWQIRQRLPDPVVIPPCQCCMKTNGTSVSCSNRR